MLFKISTYLALSTRLMSEVDNSEAAIIAKEVNAQFMQPQNAGLVSFLEVHISHEVIPLASICSALFVSIL